MLLICSPAALPCSLCGSKVLTPTFRETAHSAKLILYGQLANARLTADGASTELHIEKVLRTDPQVADKKLIKIPRYVGTDAKNNRYLVFCDIYNGQLDPYRGVPITSAAALEYVEKILTLDARDRTKTLLFYFDYLEDQDRTIGDDAFREFIAATDAELLQVAGKLPAAKLRQWLRDPRTAADRANLYASLLGLCGNDRDVELLRGLLARPSSDSAEVISGALSGLMALRPREGWEAACAMLADSRRPFKDRYAAILAVRFQYGSRPRETQAEMLRCLGGVLSQGDMADLAIEDLRRWQVWTLTEEILGQYGKKSHAAPIVRRAIVRYALCCPRPEAARFVAEARGHEPDLVGEIEEALKWDKKK
jgi:hypothetical protein